MQSITYDEIQRLLGDVHSTVDAGEAHGILVGSLAATLGYFPQDWVREVVPQGSPEPDIADTLQTLFEQTSQALEGVGMEFEPLLPDDEDALAVRGAALSGWCRGFLQGFNGNARLETSDMPDDVGEVLRDFNDIIDVDVEGADDEEAENAYTELVEFVRVGAQLVFDELEALRAQETPLN